MTRGHARARTAVAVAAFGASIALTAPVAGASPAPLMPVPVFAQRELVDPLVTAAAIDSFAGFDGTDLAGWVETTGLAWAVNAGALHLQNGAVELDQAPLGSATVATAFSNVLVRADLELPDADRATGVVVNRGFGGELHVLVETAGADQRVALYLDDGVTTTLLDASGPFGGLPSGVRLVVESRDGVVRAWADGTLVLDHTLSGAATVVLLHQDHGLFIGHPDDRVTAYRVLAPA